MTVFVYAPDLMDRSKVAAAAPSAVIVPRPELIDPAPGDTVVLDLSRDAAMGALAHLAATGARVIGFASHVDRQRAAAASADGCEVLARSAFFGRLPALLGSPAPVETPPGSEPLR
jgi:hypothetical protein